ncbi:hypothetical protein C6Q35_08450 [Burkholderia multivorans]|nr:hypothetical protein C6Q35_08450 [Burkholderia multivorans]
MRSVPGHGEIRRAAFGALPVRRATGFSSDRWYRFRRRSGRCRDEAGHRRGRRASVRGIAIGTGLPRWCARFIASPRSARLDLPRGDAAGWAMNAIRRARYAQCIASDLPRRLSRSLRRRHVEAGGRRIRRAARSPAVFLRAAACMFKPDQYGKV